VGGKFSLLMYLTLISVMLKFEKSKELAPEWTSRNSFAY